MIISSAPLWPTPTENNLIYSVSEQTRVVLVYKLVIKHSRNLQNELIIRISQRNNRSKPTGIDFIRDIGSDNIKATIPQIYYVIYTIQNTILLPAFNILISIKFLFFICFRKWFCKDDEKKKHPQTDVFFE